ncbi:unnamed protein product [Brassica rapa]|uniref:Uncharacterized protein n=1 Tax=Brassica campestris TaxID=3711 RepID=A0A8D9G7W7_BRACM|nr:unnamed protein product [Brassica rapa]
MERHQNGTEELSLPLETQHSGRIWNPEKADLKTRSNLQNPETQIYKGNKNKSANRLQICHQRALTKGSYCSIITIKFVSLSFCDKGLLDSLLTEVKSFGVSSNKSEMNRERDRQVAQSQKLADEILKY